MCHESFDNNISDLIERWEEIQGGDLGREEVGLEGGPVLSSSLDSISSRRPVQKVKFKFKYSSTDITYKSKWTFVRFKFKYRIQCAKF